LGDIDKFSRLKALRPALRAAGGAGRGAAERGSADGAEPTAAARVGGTRPLGYVPPVPQNALDLANVLGATSQSNHYGEHMVLRRWFAEPHTAVPHAVGLELLAPGAAAEAADPLNWLFLDTETTGLAGGTGTYPFLVGVAWWGGAGIEVEQFFMRDHSEEHSVLLALAERMAERRVLVTFNGKSFDWPLLETRFRMTRSIKPKLPIAHIDLLHPARHLWRPRLGSVRLCELERQVLGFERGFDVASDLIPQAYFDFLRGESPELLAHVFRHNQMDLCGLAALACRMFTLLAEPETSRIDSLELFGVSRLFDRRGQAARARTLYSAALEGGLPRVLDRSARQRLAGLAKRDRDYTLAQTLWHELRGPSPEGLCAYEELAMYFEHKAREPERAAAVAEEALADLRIAHRTRLIATAAYRDWQARFHRRLERVRRKAGLALRNPMLAESSEIAAESK
jgi:uncharacterized protein